MHVHQTERLLKESIFASKMISKLQLLIFITAIFATVHAGSGELKPGYCHNHGIYIKEGEGVPAPIGVCAHLSCIDATENKVGLVSCGLYQPRPGCKPLEEDLSKPYPDCCYRTTCND